MRSELESVNHWWREFAVTICLCMYVCVIVGVSGVAEKPVFLLGLAHGYLGGGGSEWSCVCTEAGTAKRRQSGFLNSRLSYAGKIAPAFRSRAKGFQPQLPNVPFPPVGFEFLSSSTFAALSSLL